MQVAGAIGAGQTAAAAQDAPAIADTGNRPRCCQPPGPDGTTSATALDSSRSTR